MLLGRPQQARIADAYIHQLNQTHVFDAPIVTKVEPGRDFYPAEDYHQDFLSRNPRYPYIVVNDLPKIEDLKRLFPDLYRATRCWSPRQRRGTDRSRRGLFARRRRIYCAGQPPAEISGRTAIVVDDGIATGATMRVALRAVRRRDPAHLVLAVPVAPPETLAAFRKEADEVVCLETPVMLGAIGVYYRDFH